VHVCRGGVYTINTAIDGKNDSTEISKNLVKYKSENNFVEPSK